MTKEKGSRKNIFLRLTALGLSIIFIGAISLFVLFMVVTSGVTLNTNALALSNDSQVTLLDSAGNVMDVRTNSQSTKISLDAIPEHTKNAFICMEDKRFYSHKGVDLIRIGGAIINNLNPHSNKQGGSTISQQLIKNSQLSGERTYTRKMKEIKLARDLERRYTKNEILEMYLNTIYFGNGCYGIEDASKFYFNKHASELSLNESALLVAVINAPSVYNPVTNYSKTIDRKNLVLKAMLKENKITQTEYDACVYSGINISETNPVSSYAQAAIAEAAQILNLSESNIISGNFKVSTYLVPSIQQTLENKINSGNFNPSVGGGTPFISSVVLDNASGGVVAFASNVKSDANNIKRQAGSAIKPILVYAPAFEYDVVSPATVIRDTPTDFGGYSPKNAGGVYHGNVSVRASIEKSLNIPAVKVLTYTGVNKSKDFASRLGIDFSDNDTGLSLALGATSRGVTLTQLAAAFSSFGCDGMFVPAKFIKRIENANGQVLFENSPSKTQAMKKETAYLVADCLKGVSKRGTASRLSGFDFDIASKTGTVGIKGSHSNSDAYSLSVTSEHTFATWVGASNSLKQLPPSVNGSTYPTILNKQMISSVYASHRPDNFRRPAGIVDAEISLDDLADGRVTLADPNAPLKTKRTEIFSATNLPPLSTSYNPQ